MVERGPLVMLIEDDLKIGRRYQVGLEISGFRVSVLTDESAFFRAIDVEIPDVVVVDLQLNSVITCADIIYNLRLDDRAVGMPVFVLSNSLGALDGQMDGVLAAGAIACLVKSETNPNQLAARINAVLGSPAVADGSLGGTPAQNDGYAKPAPSAAERPIEIQANRAPSNGADARRVPLADRTSRASNRN